MLILGLFEVPDWLLLVLLILIITYVIIQLTEENVFEAQGVPGPPRYPVIGTLYAVYSKGLRDFTYDCYKKYGKIFRTCEGSKTLLSVADEEMLREILVKDFGSFTNRRVVAEESGDAIVDNLMTLLKDERWKRIRTLLTPTFSTGKLKTMVRSITDCAHLLVDNLDECCEKNEAFDVKDMCSAFTMDVIARTGFGLQLDSQKDKSNDFVRMAKKAMDFKIFSLRIIITFFFPRPLARKLGMTLFDRDVVDFFSNVLTQAIEGRKEIGKVKGEIGKGQKDFLQLMINAHTEKIDMEAIKEETKLMGDDFDHTKVDLSKGMSYGEMLAQGFLFFLAGFDTTASGLALLLYNLARNPEVQEKLYDHIIEVLGDKEDLDYVDSGKLTYLDMCLEESLRLYPPTAYIDRVASREVIIKGIHIPKDTIVVIPIQGIHYDPEHYPDPFEFRPERFTAEEKAKRSPYHWLPFGYGPRNCIGMRLAILEIKIAVVELLKQFRLVTCDKTEYPLVFQKSGVLTTDKGLVLKVERRIETAQ